MSEPIRHLPFGATHACIASNYAVITPDTHVRSPRAGWDNAAAIVHISPEMGARFTQFTIELGAAASAAAPPAGIERFVFVLSGTITIEAAAARHELNAGHYAFLPAGAQYKITTDKNAPSVAARLSVFEKRFVAAGASPPMKIGDASGVPGEPFQGDPALRLQTLLPIEATYDMAVNLFTFDPGGHLPLVEVHVMEHGLLMLDGTGVYRLGEQWFPVQRGDVIWMASYCPQWFVAMGKSPARYLYYKDIHRDHLLADVT